MKDLRERTVAITGAASGIGKSLAHLLAAKGCHLALADRQMDQLIDVKAELDATGQNVSIHHVDVSNADQVRRFAREAIEIHERVHVLAASGGRERRSSSVAASACKAP